MCGIAGEIDFASHRPADPAVFESMKAALKRRGPDQDGIWSSGPATLVHTRLSVVDAKTGIQPMLETRQGQSFALVYNGELYNTDELRAELKSRGYAFRGYSDTEVLLKAYIEWGEDCVDRFNGIFAFAIWDESRRQLFMARDRIGVKPFFYFLRDGVFVFGSELKVLLCHPLGEPMADRQTIAELMLIGPGRTPGCGVFRNFYELEPACCAVYDADGLHTRKYWQLTDHEHTESFEETADHVRYLVTDSIRRQLVSDVPVGTFLSGGLDSSLISAVIKQEFEKTGKSLTTFSIDYAENDKYFRASKFQPNSDGQYIGIMNDFLGADHVDVVLQTDELTHALFDAVDARDLPGMADVDSSLLLACQRIKPYASVALSGECADELFGGYPWYRDEKIRETDGFPWAQSTAYRAGFLREEFSDGLNPSEYVHQKYRATLKDTHKLPGLSPLESRMKEMMRLNFDWFMQTLLDRKDRMSMYSGLEVRVPFCDYRIAEYLYSVPWSFKDYEGREKGLLRKAMEGYLPDEVLWRKKSPYPKTHHPDYLRAVSDLLEEVLSDPRSPLLQIIKKEELRRLLDVDNPVPWYGQLMTTPQTIAYFLQWNYWLQKYRVRLV